MEIPNIGKIISDLAEERKRKEEEKSIKFGQTLNPNISEESLKGAFTRKPKESKESSEPIKFVQTADPKIIDVEQIKKMFNKFR